MSLKYAALIALPVLLPDKEDEGEENTDTKEFTHKVRVLVPNIQEILSK